MAEIEQAHRIDVDRSHIELQRRELEENARAIKKDQWNTSLGLWLGWGLSALALLSALLSLWLDASWPLAAMFISIPVMSVARALARKDPDH
jgi:uncharacterized membrane protein